MIAGQLRFLYTHENFEPRRALLRYLLVALFPGLLCNYVFTVTLMGLGSRIGLLHLAFLVLPYGLLALRLVALAVPGSGPEASWSGWMIANVFIFGLVLLVLAMRFANRIIELRAQDGRLTGHDDYALFVCLWFGSLLLGLAVWAVAYRRKAQTSASGEFAQS